MIAKTINEYINATGMEWLTAMVGSTLALAIFFGWVYLVCMMVKLVWVAIKDMP